MGAAATARSKTRRRPSTWVCSRRMTNSKSFRQKNGIRKTKTPQMSMSGKTTGMMTPSKTTSLFNLGVNYRVKESRWKPEELREQYKISERHLNLLNFCFMRQTCQSATHP